MVTRVPYTGTEVDSLQASLDRHLDVLLWKLEGLNDEQARRVLTASGLSLLGLVKHVACAEFNWFCLAFDRPSETPIHDGVDPDAEFWVDAGESIADVVAFYSRARAAAKSTLDELPLDAMSTPKDTWASFSVSLRWALLRMIEETARHAGHADILRELLDGQTGWHPT